MANPLVPPQVAKKHVGSSIQPWNIAKDPIKKIIT